MQCTVEVAVMNQKRPCRLQMRAHTETCKSVSHSKIHHSSVLNKGQKMVQV